jgi:galactonate dehydratase
MSDHLDRRNLLAAGTAAATGLALVEAAEAQAPGKNVEDKTTTLKIKSLRGIVAGPKAYLKIETNQNITGWGEITGLDPKVAIALADSLFELIKDENPTRIEHLWQKIYRAHRDMRGGPFMTHTLSAIDMALWDITGKAWGVPVYRLLGGPVRDKVRMYPKEGKAHKLGTGGPHPFSGNPKDVMGLAKQVEDLRKRLGPEGTIMFDAHCAVPPPMLIQLGAAVAPYDILFLEEVAVPGNIEVFKRLKEQIRIPFAAGERDRTIWEFVPYLVNGALDILQPDVGQTGGISQLKKIANLAEGFMVPLAPHNTCSQLGLSASIHVAFSIPFFLIQEGYIDGHIMPAGVARPSWEQDKDGYASLPQGPGLGVEIDEEAAAKVNTLPNKKFKWPTPRNIDGAVYDY